MKKIVMAMMAGALVAFAGGNVTEVEVTPVTPEVSILNGFYVGAGYSYEDTDVVNSGIKATVNNNDGTILAGYNFNQYVAVEGRYTFTNDSYLKVAGIDVDSTDGDIWGIYVKPQYPVSDDVKVYALLGYGQTSVTSVDDGYDYADREGSFQYGAGLAFSAAKNVEVFADWVRPLDTDTQDGYAVTSDVFTVGAIYKF